MFICTYNNKNYKKTIKMFTKKPNLFNKPKQQDFSNPFNKASTIPVNSFQKRPRFDGSNSFNNVPSVSPFNTSSKQSTHYYYYTK